MTREVGTGRAALAAYGAILVAALLANLGTAALSPPVWTDEALYLDPALTLARDGRLASTAWFAQRGDEFWAGQPPLHALLLAAWIRAFGLDPTVVRALPMVCFTLAMAVLGLALARPPARWRAPALIVLALVMVCGVGPSFGYRSGRPDMVGFLAVTLVLAAAALSDPIRRRAVQAAAAALVPWTSVSASAFLALASLTAWIAGFARPATVLAIGAGGLAGTLALAGLYAAHGVLPAFVETLTRHVGGAAAVSGHGPLAFLAAYRADQSLAVALAGLALLTAVAWRRLDPVARRAVLASGGLAAATPALLGLTGIYAVYYGWMPGLAVAVALGTLADRATGAALRAGTLAVAIVAAVPGLPPRLALALWEADRRDPARVAQLVAGTVPAGAHVVGAPSAYYALAGRAARLYLPPHLAMMTAPERAAVDVVVAAPSEAAALLDRLGGAWEAAAFLRVESRLAEHGRIADALRRLGRATMPLYDLAVYRRVAPAVPPPGRD